MRASGGTSDALAACRELPGRRAMPAAGGGHVLAAMAASARPRATPAVAGGRARRRRRRLAALAALLLGLVGVPPAGAEEVFTSQAAAAHATDSTWIPAPSQRAALCIVDTGNDPNPDTSNVLARLSVDGEPGTDRSPDHHGTLMSMIAAAPYNGFGLVGAAPSINIVSVRASRDGVSFGGTDLAAGIQQCLTYRTPYNIKVISLSLGGSAVAGLDAGAMATIEDIVSSARFVGLDVLAAAGNHPGAVDWPAAYAPVLAIGAADPGGARCAFAASGPEVDLWTSGCPLDAAFPDGSAAWASGSSEATAFVGAALTQLRQLAPALTVDQAERFLLSNSRALIAGASLDVGAAFAAVGLTEQLAAGHAAMPSIEPSGTTLVRAPSPVPPESPPVPQPTTTALLAPAVVPKATREDAGPARLPRPSAQLSRRGRVVSLVLRNKPARAQAYVEVFARRRGASLPRLARTVRTVGDRLRTTISGTVTQVSITYRDPAKLRDASVVTILRTRK